MYEQQKQQLHILNDSWPSTDNFLWDTTNKCTYRYGDLLCYNQCSLLHVSATYCGHLQGGVLWSNIT